MCVCVCGVCARALGSGRGGGGVWLQYKHKHTCSGHTWHAGLVLLKFINANKQSLLSTKGGVGQKVEHSAASMVSAQSGDFWIAT